MYITAKKYEIIVYTHIQCSQCQILQCLSRTPRTEESLTLSTFRLYHTFHNRVYKNGFDLKCIMAPTVEAREHV